MAKLGEIGTQYSTTNELLTRFGQPAEPCPTCGCAILFLLHTGEAACGECGPAGRQASMREVAYRCLVVTEPDGRTVLAELDAEQRAATEARERRGEIDLSTQGHGVWLSKPGGVSLRVA